MAKGNLCTGPRWVKLEIGMLHDTKLMMIDKMKDRDLIHYIWTSSLLLAGESNRNGMLYINDDMPYTYETLALVFRRTIKSVKKSIKVLIDLGMIEVIKDNVFKITNWEKHQNIESLDSIRRQTKERVARYRQRKKKDESTKDNVLFDDDSYMKSSEEEIDAVDSSFETCSLAENEIENNIAESDFAEDEHGDGNCDDKNEIAENNDRISGHEEKVMGSISELKNEKCNVTKESFENDVTQQNKNNKKKNKNKKKECEIEKKSNTLSNKELVSEAVKLESYCEDITGRAGVLDIGALNLAISIHNKENVKKAIDKAIEVGKINMNYISGILRNWRREGYPKENLVGGKVNDRKCNSKSAGTDKFEIIIPKARVLSDEERRKIEAEVL